MCGSTYAKIYVRVHRLALNHFTWNISDSLDTTFNSMSITPTNVLKHEDKRITSLFFLRFFGFPIYLCLSCPRTLSGLLPYCRCLIGVVHLIMVWTRSCLLIAEFNLNRDLCKQQRLMCNPSVCSVHSICIIQPGRFMYNDNNKSSLSAFLLLGGLHGGSSYISGPGVQHQQSSMSMQPSAQTLLQGTTRTTAQQQPQQMVINASPEGTYLGNDADGTVINIRLMGGAGKMLPTVFSPHRLHYLIGRTKTEILTRTPVNIIIMISGSARVLEDEAFWPRINNIPVKPKAAHRLGGDFVVQACIPNSPMYQFRFERMCTRCNCTESTAEFCRTSGGRHSLPADFTEKDNSCCSGCIESAMENRKRRQVRAELVLRCIWFMVADPNA